MPGDPLRAFAEGAAIPLSVITGFLGSGKTTLLNRLLRDPSMGDSAVLVNELGEIGIDHLAVQEVQENVVLLASGCLCCAIRSDLVAALRLLFVQRLQGEVPPFRRVVIETTGLADPVPVIHTLMTDPLLLERFRLDAMVTTVDACHGERQLEAFAEAVKQVVVADGIVLTKLDLRGDDAPDLRARLRGLNPGVVPLPADQATAARLFASTPVRRNNALRRWVAEAVQDESSHSPVRTVCLSTEHPLDWAEFTTWLGALLSAHGPTVLRCKGVLDVAGRDRPVVINGVQHVFYPAEELQAWPEGARRTQLVFITRDLPPETIPASFHQRFGSRAGAAL
ncbi:GTP-binding protein [Sphingomonas sp.]|uniref:CobW family GTP-binding protein n=1 Tax=Sphingomonas sp. TaxID=28214 RepID=UPI0035B08C98